MFEKVKCSTCPRICVVHPNVAKFIDPDIQCRHCVAKHLLKLHGLPIDRTLARDGWGAKRANSSFNSVW